MQPQLGIFSKFVDMGKHAFAVFLAKDTPLYVKILLGAGLIYAISPYDLIPEWVPVVGLLDDIAIAALLIAWAQSFKLPKD